MADKVGEGFQRETKYHRGEPFSGMDWSGRPETYKRYPQAVKVQLPEPAHEEGPPIWTIISQRRSVRNFTSDAMRMEDLSQLLWACQGITSRRNGHDFRASPSAGALYPVETYLVANNVEGVDSGVYHYTIPGHQLDLLKKRDFRRDVARSALDQEMAYSAPIVFIWTGIFQRSKWKYGQRGYRYVYMDAGHLVENLALAAIALGLGSCQIGALYDDEANAIIGVDGEEESVIYMSVVGRPV